MEKEVIKTKLMEFISYAIIFVIILFSIEFYELHFIIPFFLFFFCLICVLLSDIRCSYDMSEKRNGLNVAKINYYK